MQKFGVLASRLDIKTEATKNMETSQRFKSRARKCERWAARGKDLTVVAGPQGRVPRAAIGGESMSFIMGSHIRKCWERKTPHREA